MDPRSKLYNKILKVEDIIHVIDEWLSRGHLYMWDKTPEELKKELRESGDTILYGKMIQIIDNAKTHKMPGHANRGLEYFKLQCKAMKNDPL